MRLSLNLKRDPVAAAFARSPVPHPDTPWRQAAWCAVDLELTGLDRSDEIIAIGAVPIRDGALILGEAMYTLARPEHPPKHASVLVHKLRSADLSAAPPADEAIDRLLQTLAGHMPVFHTAFVERTFLGRGLRPRRVRLPPDADTEALGRLWLQVRDGTAPGALSLARLAAALSLPAEDPHHALGDALTTAKAFVALATHLDALSPQTVELLCTARQQLMVAQSRGPAAPGAGRRMGPG